MDQNQINQKPNPLPPPVVLLITSRIFREEILPPIWLASQLERRFYAEQGMSI